MNMTEQEARDVMKALGWTFLRRMRRAQAYVYAERRVKDKVEERYICPLATLASLTSQDLQEKLA